MSIQSLSSDLRTQVLKFLPSEDLSSVFKTCKDAQKSSKNESFWKVICQSRNILDKELDQSWKNRFLSLPDNARKIQIHENSINKHKIVLIGEKLKRFDDLTYKIINVGILAILAAPVVLFFKPIYCTLVEDSINCDYWEGKGMMRMEAQLLAFGFAVVGCSLAAFSSVEECYKKRIDAVRSKLHKID